MTDRAELFTARLRIKCVLCLSMFDLCVCVLVEMKLFWEGVVGEVWGSGGELKCGAVSGAARRILPRMVLALLELVAEARFPKQQSLRNKHKHLKKWMRLGRFFFVFLLGWRDERILGVFVKNNYKCARNRRRRPLAALRWRLICARSIPERGAGRRAEVARCVGRCALVVWPLFS